MGTKMYRLKKAAMRFLPRKHKMHKQRPSSTSESPESLPGTYTMNSSIFSGTGSKSSTLPRRTGSTFHDDPVDELADYVVNLEQQVFEAKAGKHASDLAVAQLRRQIVDLEQQRSILGNEVRRLETENSTLHNTIDQVGSWIANTADSLLAPPPSVNCRETQTD